jgi:pimeloyl-ACP methyl ester carboxylesterase
MTFVLVHGAWHGPWCWERLVPELEARGERALTVDLPTEDPDAGLAVYARLIAETGRTDDDVVLVGHSLGGAAIPLTARLRPVARLVFLCALLPAPGRSATDRYTSESVFDDRFRGHTVTREDGASYWPSPEAAIDCLFHDCKPADAAWAASLLRPQSAAPRLEPWPLDPLPDVPRTSIVCADDRSIRPEWSRTTARELLGTEPVELDGGHSPFLSRPGALADLLVGLA